MQLVRRPLAPKETDHELIWLLISLGGLMTAAAWFALHLPWPRCAFQTLTGHPCVTCGATRSAIAFFHGQFPIAWKWNPLVFVGYCALSIFDAYAFTVLILRAGRIRVALSSTEKNRARAFFVVLLAVNWIYRWGNPPL
ncbi:MAG: DUF2752 domain-containing protein [Spartobacteria bacterium]